MILNANHWGSCPQSFTMTVNIGLGKMQHTHLKKYQTAIDKENGSVINYGSSCETSLATLPKSNKAILKGQTEIFVSESAPFFSGKNSEFKTCRWCLEVVDEAWATLKNGEFWCDCGKKVGG